MLSMLCASLFSPFIHLFKEHLLKHICFIVEVGRNVEDLDRSAKTLEAKRLDVGDEIQDGERLGKRPKHEVEKRRRDAEAYLQGAKSIRKEYDSRNCIFPGTTSCSFNCFSNYCIGRRAAEELSNVEDANKYFEGVKEITREPPQPPAQEMSTTPLTGAGADDEIKKKLEMALDFLRDDAKGAMGLWGMGGVGKTNILKHVNNSLAEDPSGFHRVVFLVASANASVKNIKEGLRKELGLKDGAKIFGYLRNKSFVLLLDDLWRHLDLEEVGIPLPLGAVGQCKRKLILTARSQQVCESMGALSMKVECLSPDAAWGLFLNTVGEAAISSHPHPRIRELAREVADECDGLPLALITIGRAMAGVQEVHDWQNAVNQIRDSNPSNIPSYMQGEHDPLLPRLKFSYDHLSPTHQLCFLNCALWPEDYHIPKVDLIECWMGHGLLEDAVYEIQKVYDRGYAIIEYLLKACLLERVEPHKLVLKNEYVKLHGVFRDMALWIARDCGENQKKWMVLEGALTHELPQDTRVWSEVHIMSSMGGSIEGFPLGIQSCPKLSTLYLQHDSLLASRGMRAVKYFSKLRYLNLTGCDLLVEFPIEICSLEKLEYLNITGCSTIISLPNELKNLRALKYLIACRTRISRLPGDLISNLVSLLYLNLIPKGYMSQSSIIDDLSCVKGRLKCIGISVSTVPDIEQLVGLDNMCIRHLCIQRMEGIASLQLLTSNVLQSKHMHSNLKQLHISDCTPTFKELVVDEELHLSNLNELRLCILPGLKEVIWKGVRPQKVLPNLCIINIVDCRLEHVTWTVYLPCLECLVLHNCKNMKHLILERAVAEPIVIGFPSLRVLHMKDLPNLDSIYHGVLAFPSLEYLKVDGCMRLKKLPFQLPPSIRNMKEILGETKWWNNLEMDDDTRYFLQPFFASSDGTLVKAN